MKLASDGLYGEPETFDVAFANPPYYAHFRIAELFVLAAHRALKRGGVLYLVTKNPNWYDQQMPGTWAEIQIVPSKLYHVVVAKKA